jgi:predicted TIM-barrel fold metal-dependent hydrolase
MDRMDEEWAKRGRVEAPLCREKPSEYLKSGQLYFAAEGDEQSLPEVVRRLGDDIIFYASDVPHWDNDFPANVQELAARTDLSVETRRKLLYENTRRLYAW